MGGKVSTGSSLDISGKISEFFGVNKQWTDVKDSVSTIVSLPTLIVTYLKWVAIGGAVMATIFFGVFIWRFSRGNAPDIGSAARVVAGLTPQGRVLNALV